jgi:hypothetical protein
MAATDISHPTRQQLARRLNHGIEVTLWCDAHTSPVKLMVQDRNSGEHLDVDGDSALDAIQHSHADAASRLMATAGAW